MNGDAFAAGDVADDLFAADGIATSRAIDEEIVLAFDLERVGPGEVQLAHRVGHGLLDGAGLLRLCCLRAVWRIGVAGRELVEHLVRGVLACAEGGEQVGGGGDAVFAGDAGEVLVVDLAHGDFESARFALKQLAADLDGAAALVFVEPVLDLVAGARTFDEGEPVAAGLVVLLRDDFDDVAGAQLGAQRHHAAVNLGADAGVANFSVNGVGEVDGGAVGGNHNDFPFGREGVDLVGIEVHLQAGEEFVGVRHLLLPLDELANPVEALFVAGGDDAVFGLVFPVRGDALFSDAVHLFGADLHFELMAAFADDRGVEGLIAVGAGDGDEVLDAAGHGTPERVDQAEDGVTGGDVVGDDANGEQVVDLIERDLGALEFLEDGVVALDAPLDARLDVVLAQAARRACLQRRAGTARPRRAGLRRLRRLFRS